MSQYNIKVEIIRICCDLMLQSVMFHVSLQSLFAQICCKICKISETLVFKVTQNHLKLIHDKLIFCTCYVDNNHVWRQPNQMFHTGYSAQAASLSATLGQPAVSILHGGAPVLSAQVLSELSTLNSSSS